MTGKKILVTGASGFLGRKLYDKFSPENKVVGTFHGHQEAGLLPLDVIRHDETIEMVRAFHPDIVFHTVALSSPFDCEKNPKLAEQINVVGTNNIVEACRATGAKLFFWSTSFVFDGTKPSPYVETDIPNPINVYGRTKLDAEEIVRELEGSVIFRSDKMYGYNGAIHDNDLFGKLIAGEKIDSNDRQISRPLWVDDVVKAVSLLDEQDQKGIYHIAGPTEMKRTAFLDELANLAGKHDLIREVNSSEQLVNTPINMALATEKIRALGFRFTPPEIAFERIHQEMEGFGQEKRRSRIGS